MAKGRRQPPELRVDTYDALASLVRALGGKVRPAAKILETGYSHLWQQLKHKRPPPTVDSLALYANRIRTPWAYDQEQRCGYNKQRSFPSFRRRKPLAYKNVAGGLLAHARHATQRHAELTTTEAQ